MEAPARDRWLRQRQIDGDKKNRQCGQIGLQERAPSWIVLEVEHRLISGRNTKVKNI